jgi:hypothetical protein
VVVYCAYVQVATRSIDPRAALTRRAVSYIFAFAVISQSGTVSARRWTTARHLYGRGFWSACARCASIRVQTRVESDKTVGFVVLTGFVLFAWNPAFLRQYPGAVMLWVSVPVIAIIDRLLAPAILVLGTSRSETIDLEMFVTWYAAPLPIASFILPTAAHSRVVREQVGMFSLRARRSSEWRSVVRSLVDMCPVVVIDARVLSANVREELSWMIVPERRFKVLVVGELPQGLCHGLKPRDIARVTEESDFCEAITYIRRFMPERPTRYRPLADMLRTFAAAARKRQRAGKADRWNK